MKRILLIRHGQTDWNAEGRYQGFVDVPLNATGIAQAQALAAHLSDRPIRAVYSSDLQRAHATAAAIAARFGLSVQDDPRWRELHLGVFQGLTTSEITAKYPREMQQMRDDYMDYVVPQGESRRAMQERVYAAYREIAVNEIAPEIAVVAHGGPIRVLLLKLFGDEILHRSVQNTSVSIIETDGESHRLLETAGTPHLVE
jgi:broad specificity phosphatase PhoE